MIVSFNVIKMLGEQLHFKRIIVLLGVVCIAIVIGTVNTMANANKLTNVYNTSMNRVVLKKNIVGGVNKLTQDMLPLDMGANTIYVIAQDYIIDKNITIPQNAILKFDGGSISNSNSKAKIEGQNTTLESPAVQIFNDEILLSGSWNTSEASPEWFGAKGDGYTDDTKAIQKTLNIFNCVSFQNKIYIAEDLIINKDFFSIKGIGASTIKATKSSNHILRVFVTYRKSKQREIKNLTLDCNNKSQNGLILNCVQTLCENLIVLNPISNGIIANNDGFTVGSPFELVLNNTFVENKNALTSSYEGVGINLKTSDCTIKDYVSVNMHISAIVGGANVVDNAHPYCGSPIFESSVGIIVDGLGNTINNCYFDCVMNGVVASRTTVLSNCKFFINGSLYDKVNTNPVFITSKNNAIIYADHCYFENAENREYNPYIANTTNVRLINPLMHPTLFYTQDDINDYIISNVIKEKRYRINCEGIIVPAKSPAVVEYIIPNVGSNDFYTLTPIGSFIPDGIVYSSLLSKDKIIIRFYNTTNARKTISNSFYLTVRKDSNEEPLTYTIIK